MAFDPKRDLGPRPKPGDPDPDDSARQEFRRPGEDDPRAPQRDATGPASAKPRFLTLPVSAAFRWIRGRLS